MANIRTSASSPLSPRPRKKQAGPSPKPRVGYLDIETTGLSPQHAQVTVLGVLCAHKAAWRLSQFFVDSPGNEREVLKRARKVLESLDYVVTYNGRAFDLPFLRQRAQLHGLRWPWVETLDLLPLARRFRMQTGRIESCQLGSVMAAFGLERNDALGGADCIDAYQRWLQRGRKRDRAGILEHNAVDIWALPEVERALSAALEE